MQSYFNKVADSLSSLILKDEAFTTYFSAETSDFSRFNHAKIRQAGRVFQVSLNFELIKGKKHAQSKISLSLDWQEDKIRLQKLLNSLRSIVDILPEDPYLPKSPLVRNSVSVRESSIPSAQEISAQITDEAKDLDLVGILAQGTIYRGFANSSSQRNWFESNSFNFDFSLYYERDIAVKSAYAGLNFDAEVLTAKISNAALSLEQMKKPVQQIKPGKYPVYLAPAAVSEIISLLQWGGFSAHCHKNKNSPLSLMSNDGRHLSPLVDIYEDTLNGLAPGFQEDGYIKSEQLMLIEKGKLQQLLISPRTAVEFSLTCNAAANSECIDSVAMSAGVLEDDDVLAALGDGIFISNLWYLNFSDRFNGRMTGMTRFGSCMVKNGQILGPLAVMRFDDSIFNILGSQLVSLTKKREFMIDSGSYSERSCTSFNLPGLLVKDFNFTL